jgi:hypothetical protein
MRPRRAQTLTLLVLALAGYAGLPASSEAEERGAALEVSGLAGGSGPVSVELEAIMAMPRTSFTCVDPWDGKDHEFAGTLLLPLLESLGLPRQVKSLEVTAWNAYRVFISEQDLRRHRYLLAYSLDGRIMRGQPELRKRGTLMIAIDFGASPDLDVDLYKAQLVWQVRKIVVR